MTKSDQHYGPETITKERLILMEVAHHRNGITGIPFRVALFKDRDVGMETTLVGIMFDDRPVGRCAVLDVHQLAQDEIMMGQNSWRGSMYEEALRELVDEALSE